MMEQPGYKPPFTPQEATGRRYPLQFLCDLAYAVLDDETGDLLEYQHLMKDLKYKGTWLKFGTEICRLVTTTETIFFKRKDEIPHDRRKDITYGCVVCTYPSEKKDPYQTRLTMGGNLVNYPNDCRTPTADLLTVKLLLKNNIISTANAKIMTIDIKYFYLMTPMKRYEYFRMKIDLFPQDIIEEFNLMDKVDHDGNVFCEVCHGMYVCVLTWSPGERGRLPNVRTIKSPSSYPPP